MLTALVERIRREGRVLPGDLLKVDGFLNHRLEPELTMRMGEAFRERFATLGVDAVDLVVTAEVSGIAPAFATAVAFGVPLVYARKNRPATMPGAVLRADAPSRTKGGTTPLFIAPDVLGPGDRALLIDDFLATGLTIGALAELIHRAGARLTGVGVVIEKSFQGGRAELDSLDVPIVALAIVDALDATRGLLDVREG